MSDVDDRDPEDRDLIDFGLKMAALELELGGLYIDADAEAAEVLEALGSGRAVLTDGWGTEEYLDDLTERLRVAVAFPVTPWWRPEESA